MFEMLNKHILRERPGTEESFENGLIGVVVWRRAHISNAISPNSSSHQKHAFKKQPLAAPPKRFHDSPNLNPLTPTRKSQLPPPDDDDDDIPPGFGPGAAEKDDDDLPEFNFSARELNPSASRNSLHGFKKLTRPVEDVRELIKKDGQSGPSVVTSKSVVVDDRRLGIEPWNDDDDDDIPEWRPQAPQLPHHQPYAVPHGHQLPLHLHPSDGRTPPPAVTQLQRPPGGAWAPPPGYQHGPRWRQY